MRSDEVEHRESSMFEVRPYDGTAEELSRFVVGTWRGDYAGKMAFPLWSADYLRWQLRLDDSSARHHQLAAYTGGKLVGALLGLPSSFRTAAGVVSGQHGSWLSIDPAFRGQGMVGELTRERFRQQQEHGAGLIVGYRFVGSKHSLAERPNPKKPDPTRAFHGKLGFWARVLDATRAAAWNVSPLESALTRIGGPFTPNPPAKSFEGIRPFAASDLTGCLAVLYRQAREKSLSVEWTESDLRHHLTGSPLSQTFVAESPAGEIRGLVNFHILPFLARTEEPVAVIDIIAQGELSWLDGDRLLNAALHRMREQGAILALKLRCGDAPWGTMLRTHFVPRLPDSYLVLQWTDAVQSLPRGSALHLLWR